MGFLKFIPRAQMARRGLLGARTSKKQPLVAMHTQEAEYIQMAIGICAGVLGPEFVVVIRRPGLYHSIRTIITLPYVR